MKKLLLSLILISSLVFPSICFSAAADMYVTVAGGGGSPNGGTTWADAFSLAEWETDAGTGCSSEAGDRYFIKSGTYTLNEAWSCPNDGNQATYIEHIGVTTGTTAEPPTSADWAYGSDRPDIVAAANTFDNDDRFIMRNLDVTGTGTTVMSLGSNCIVSNCKVTNTSGSTGRKAVGHWVYTLWILNSELSSTKGIGVGLNGGMVYNSYIHNCEDECVDVSNDNGIIIGNVLETCTEVGVRYGNDEDKVTVIGNTIYGSGTGIDMDDSSMSIIVNNIIDANTTGAELTTDNTTVMFDYNVWDNTAECTNCTQGPNKVEGDPDLNAPDGSDFTLKSGSNAIDAGDKLSTTVHEGIVGTYKNNSGVDQDDNTVGGGGSVTVGYGGLR